MTVYSNCQLEIHWHFILGILTMLLRYQDKRLELAKNLPRSLQYFYEHGTSTFRFHPALSPSTTSHPESQGAPAIAARWLEMLQNEGHLAGLITGHQPTKILKQTAGLSEKGTHVGIHHLQVVTGCKSSGSCGCLGR